MQNRVWSFRDGAVLKIGIDIVDKNTCVFTEELRAHWIEGWHEAVRRAGVSNLILALGTMTLFAVLPEQIFTELDISNDERGWARRALRASDDWRRRDCPCGGSP